MYLNSAAYLYGQQIKSKLRNKLYLWMIVIDVHLNLRYLRECPTMIPREDAGGLSREYVLRIPSVS